MGRAEESARGAQADRPDDERAPGREADTRATGDAGGRWWQETTEPSRLDVLWPSCGTDWHDRGDGRIPPRQKANRRTAQGVRELEAGEGCARGIVYAGSECEYCAGYSGEDQGGPHVGHQETRTGCI